MTHSRSFCGISNSDTSVEVNFDMRGVLTVVGLVGGFVGTKAEYPSCSVGFGFAAVGNPSGKWIGQTLEKRVGVLIFAEPCSFLFMSCVHFFQPSEFFSVDSSNQKNVYKKFSQ